MNRKIERTGQWASLAVVSGLLSGILQWFSVPAATLLGPMVAGVGFALRGTPLVMPRWAFSLSQAVIGVLVARAITPSVLKTFVQQGPVMVLAVLTVVVSGAVIGYLLMRYGSLAGSTAAWGMSPGGASVMTALAEDYGADIRMVAFMQYMRLFVVVLTAAGVSHLLGHGSGAALPGHHAWSLGFDAPVTPLLETLGVIVAGALIARLIHFPSARLLVPMILGATLNMTGVVDLTLPFWLVVITYFILGWYIGLRFTSAIVRHAIKAIPQILICVVILILLCCGAAWMLTAWAGVDGLTAYLATSPGGLDTVIAIALSSKCDIPFVLCLQTFRLFAVIIFSPLIAKFICRLSDAREGGE